MGQKKHKVFLEMTDRVEIGSYPTALVASKELSLSEVTAITPIDGRYSRDTRILRPYFSEYALIRGRVFVEIKYLEALSEVGIVRPFTPRETRALNRIWESFTPRDAKRVKLSEARTRHDVKSMEYFLKDSLKGSNMFDVLEFVHFGLTSEDPTNLAQSLFIGMVKDGILVPSARRLVAAMDEKAEEWGNHPMVGKTHERKSETTTVAKEVELYATRLDKQVADLAYMRLTGKLNSAVGNFNALKFAAPEINWVDFSDRFVASLGLEPNLFTTQVEPHDRWAELFHNIIRMNTIVRTFDRNMRRYIGRDYFVLPPREGQIGSSIMPQKGRNPIGYENSAGSTYVSNWLLEGFARELPDRVLQRDLEDSTIARYIGEALAVALLAYENARSDLQDTLINSDAVEGDLSESWELVMGGVQTRLRRIGVDRPYERADEFAKGGPITRDRLIYFITNLPIDETEQMYLLSLTPENYTGYADELADMMHKQLRLPS